jgi:hypothetical protein
MKITVFRDVTLCGVIVGARKSEEFAASIFRVEEEGIANLKV